MGFDLVGRLLFPSPASSYGPASFPDELIYVPVWPAGGALAQVPSWPADGAGGSGSGSGSCGGSSSSSSRPERVEPRRPSCVPCLFLEYPSARFVVLYIHSNAEDLGRCRPFLTSFRSQFQVHVLAVEYPGYGIASGGPCDEHRATENAFAAMRFIREVLRWPLDSILVLGRSIGCGPAIRVATKYEVAGLILISPMLSFKALCRDVVGWFAASAFEERFPNAERIKQVASPLLVVHGQQDEVIPCRHGVELFKACRTRKLLVSPPTMAHNTDLLSDVNFLVLPMLQFFALPDYCFEELVIPAWAYAPAAGGDDGLEAELQRHLDPPTVVGGAKTERQEPSHSVLSMLRWLLSDAAAAASSSDTKGAGSRLRLKQRGLAALGPEAPRGRSGAMPSTPSAKIFVGRPASPQAAREPPPPPAAPAPAPAGVVRAAASPQASAREEGEEGIRVPQSSMASRLANDKEDSPSRALIAKGGLMLPASQERTASRSMLQKVSRAEVQPL